ncbi:MAG: sigma-54 dependent transcriptional regulator [Deltaproteobacteria bacterium]|nr:sigma-54 dependent transcriptional regulator [Deltaproteobacteria bacterium]
MRSDVTSTSFSPALLVVDDEPDFLRGLARSIPKEIPYRVLTAETGEEALRLLDKHPVELVLTDIRMPDMNGIQLLEEIKSRDPWITVVVMTAYGTIESAIDAIKKGAYDFVQKPFTPDEINRLLKKALERNNLVRENLRLKNQLAGAPTVDLFVCGGPGMRKLLRTFRTVAALNVTVLIRGESGTGKEFAARHIHMLSPRSERRMVTVNCPTLPESLLESELFGYAKGAFTGAHADKKGLIQEAVGSTLFLDEIGDISPAIQTKLLRLIQEKEIKPLGNSVQRSVDVRIIASTNSDLEAKIVEKSFREDLFYRLNVVTIFMPPLRDIREDIPVLAQRFVQEAASEFDIPPKSITVDAMKYLVGRPWPGNIRQLRNSIQKAMIFSKTDSLKLGDFTEERGAEDLPQSDNEFSCLPYRSERDQLVADFTVGYLVEALTRNNGNISAAARDSGLERQHFQKLMRKSGLRSASFRQ